MGGGGQHAKGEINHPKHVWMPTVAGVFHLMVFLTASISLVASLNDSFDYSEFVHYAARVDMAVALAYSFDLICCYVEVVPFSRCKSGREIFSHHFPKLFLCIPLLFPVWFRLTSLEPFATVASGPQFQLVLRVNGLGAISSLNEVIMCFQRAELSHAGIYTTLNTKPKEKYIGIWSSRQVELFELLYKLAFFVFSALLSFHSSIGLDIFFYNYHREVALEGASTLRLLFQTFSRSPLQIATLLWRIFMVTNYPFMAKRTVMKINSFFANKDAKLIKAI